LHATLEVLHVVLAVGVNAVADNEPIPINIAHERKDFMVIVVLWMIGAKKES
jgi:hypothetical protein